MSAFSIEIAGLADDIPLQSLMSQCPMEGRIRMCFLTSPRYFDSIGVMGKFNQAVVVRDSHSGKIVGFGARCIKPAYLNGQVRSLGYLSHLRSIPDYRRATLLARGYRYLKSLHGDGRAPLYISTIIEGNAYAKEQLTSRRCGLPGYYDQGVYYTCALAIKKDTRASHPEINVQRGSVDLLDGIVSCLNRNGSTKQFYPYYTKDDFISGKEFLRGFCISDFYVAMKQGKIVGVAGKWDQRSFKQAVIAGYSGSVGVMRPFYNLAARFLRLPKLPAPKTHLAFFYLSFIAVDADDREIFRALVRSVCNDPKNTHFPNFIIGLHSRDPLLKLVRAYRHVKYASRLYAVCWDDGDQLRLSLDGRVPYLEAAAL